MPTTPHHQGTYARRARAVRLAAYANPATTCWRCGLTLEQHTPHKNGKPVWWTAGHIVDSDTTSPLAPEASTCNYQAGGRLRHQRRTDLSW